MPLALRGFVRKHRGHFCNLSLPRERVWWLFKISGSIHRGTRRSSRSGWAAALGCSGRTTLLEALPPDSLPRSWELLPALSSRVGISAARRPPGTQPRREQRPSEGSRRVRFPGGAGRGAAALPPSSSLLLRPPPPPSSLRGRVGGRANFTERPQVAGCACGVRRGAWRRGEGFPKPWLCLRRPPPAASGIGIVGRTDRSPAARTPPAWRRFPPSEGTSPAAPPSLNSPGTQSGRRGERGPSIF